jgi:hypothetical protein
VCATAALTCDAEPRERGGPRELRAPARRGRTSAQRQLAEVYACDPSLDGIAIAAGIWGMGVLVFTAMARVPLAVTEE